MRRDNVVTIHVCIGSACHLKGSYNVINGLQEIIKEKSLEEKVEVKAAFCLGECSKAVSVKVDDSPIYSVNKDNIKDFFNTQVVGRL
jgi:NADH:ubiquinone oxidoreductase subunit E|nr:(2Fe-2S) ferredoxin domain-containing protein [Tissierella simiarum]